MNWFEVDKQGLSKLIEGRGGKKRAIAELIQNAWDEKVAQVDVRLERKPRSPYVTIEVEDDSPAGFADLTHSWTLFADSKKKGDPEKRGRFNLGEKLLLSLCKEATVETTTGGVRFDDSGRTRTGRKREKGSKLICLVRMTDDELADAESYLRSLIPPVTTRINEVALPIRHPIASCEASLSTEIADREGVLRRTRRKCNCDILEPQDGEPAMLYEMGIPVVETWDKWHVNVMQKVPLTLDRDNVPPSYLRDLRTVVLNHMHEQLAEDDSSSTWVREAFAHEKCSAAAIKSVMRLRFGEDVVTYDPSDIEANSKAFAAGYQVIKGRQLSRGEWDNVRRANLAPPAGRVTPSKPPVRGTAQPIPPSEWSPEMRFVADYFVKMASKLMSVRLEIVMLDTRDSVAATYERLSSDHGRVTFHVESLGRDWFSDNHDEKIDDLMIHEFGHHFESNHLSNAYHQALTRLGAKLARLLRQGGC